MKLFDELTPAEKSAAIEMEKEIILTGLVEGWIKFPDPAAQQAVQEALATAARRQTPWFAAAYIYDSLQVLIDSEVAQQVKGILYSERHEVVRDGIAGMTPDKNTRH